MNELLYHIREYTGLKTIVEGKKDRLALEKLGFKQVFELNKALFMVAEEFDKKDTVQILTDFDKEGKKLYGRLVKELSRRGVRISNRLRNLILKTKISHIEGLYSYLTK